MTAPLRPDKRLGQHFLSDEAVIENLVAAINPRQGQNIVEIGPGLGALTVPVLRACQAMTAIEFDARVLSPLRVVTATVGALNLIQADILSVDFVDLALKPPLRLIGNLPYNLSSPILFHCLAQRHLISDMHFMLQKEVVERVVAMPNSKTYGRLSIMTQLYCKTDNLFEIAPTAFNPPPKVDSALLRLQPLPEPRWTVADFALFDQLVRSAFQQRRKMLRKSLKPYFNEADFAHLNIDATARPENLGGQDFACLANHLQEKKT